MYQIKLLNHQDEILSCPQFLIQFFNWGGNYRPYSYGYAGLLKEKGLLVRLYSQEADPLCTYDQSNDPVYLDSALEAFFQLDPEHSKSYINLELNAAGVLLAKFGEGREKRTFFSQKQIDRCHVRHGRSQDFWWVQILLPFSVIEDFYGPLSLEAGSKIRCNFYKISENKSLEHYASYAPIYYPKPNFHLPEFFADAVISK